MGAWLTAPYTTPGTTLLLMFNKRFLKHLADLIPQVTTIFWWSSQKHTYIILTPVNPIYIIVNWGLQGYTFFFLFSAQKHRLWVLVRTALVRRFKWVPTKAVQTSTHNLCFEQKYKKISEYFIWKFSFLVVKFSVYLNRRVFVMFWSIQTWTFQVPCLDRVNSWTLHCSHPKIWRSQFYCMYLS